MNNKEFIAGVKSIAKEKNISENVIFEGMEQALITAYKKNFNSKTNVKVTIDRETGEIKVVSYLVVVKDYSVLNEDGTSPVDYDLGAEVLLSEIKDEHPNAKVGDVIETEVTPHDFGRVAAGTAKQVLMQKIREAEKLSVVDEFADKQDELMVGMLAMEDARNYYVDLGRTRGILPKNEMIPGEEVKMGSSIKVYITKVEAGPKGPVILVSRKHYGFIRRLLESEIPEFADGTIELYSVAREPGVRSKVAVFSNNEKVDPIGACIGEGGSRIASINKELNGEKIDLILYDPDISKFIANALAPAKNVTVNIISEEDKESLAIVNDENLPLAIGKKGSNVILASRLTKYKINVKTLTQINEEGNESDLSEK
ncbi:MAG: transcription termination/antitermination protein NusA [Mollicutes bacterium]|nr:transcription termination/antitermination protein NusA [Mollicutes bacterium]